mmetsp:Transcript_94174/g.155709  ORF Transcript_94174/g.155709 Transcript_94174/m.155709 type:complete len:229 (-) Transcript_94174:11-697(-)
MLMMGLQCSRALRQRTWTKKKQQDAADCAHEHSATYSMCTTNCFARVLRASSCPLRSSSPSWNNIQSLLLCQKKLPMVRAQLIGNGQQLTMQLRTLQALLVQIPYSQWLTRCAAGKRQGYGLQPSRALLCSSRPAAATVVDAFRPIGVFGTRAAVRCPLVVAAGRCSSSWTENPPGPERSGIQSVLWVLPMGMQTATFLTVSPAFRDARARPHLPGQVHVAGHSQVSF